MGATHLSAALWLDRFEANLLWATFDSQEFR